MKFLSLIILFVVTSASALNLPAQASVQRNPNPWMRTCRVAGGNSLVLSLDQDQVLLCQLGSSLLGSYDLFLLKTAGKQTSSVQNLLAGITSVSACARVVTTEDLDGNSYEICVFVDGSMVDKSSLVKGLNHSDNEKLNEVLHETNSEPFNSLSPVRPRL